MKYFLRSIRVLLLCLIQMDTKTWIAYILFLRSNKYIYALKEINQFLENYKKTCLYIYNVESGIIRRIFSNYFDGFFYTNK